MCSGVMQVPKPARFSSSGCATRSAINCRQRVVCLSVRSPNGSAHGPTSSSNSAISITATAAASALLAKVAVLMAAGVGPGVLLAALHPSSGVFKGTERVYQLPSSFQGPLAGKVPVALAPAPATQSAVTYLLSEWVVVTSAADWFEQNRQAAAAGALLATVFVSDKAARAHGSLLKRLRRNYGTGPNAHVRFVFVHIADGYAERNKACGAAAAIARGPQGLTVGRVSHTAATHGLDVALSSFLPDGIRSFPSLLLTAGPAAADGSAHWSATTRVGELTQLVSDWAFFNSRRSTVVRPSSQPAVVEAPAVVIVAAPRATPQAAPRTPPMRVAGKVRTAAVRRDSVVLVPA